MAPEPKNSSTPMIHTNVFNRSFGIFLERISSINALVYLENKTRYSGRSMGFVSALVLPMLTIVMMYSIGAFIRHRQPGNMSLEIFILTGMLVWLTYNYSANAFTDLMRRLPSPLEYHHVVVSFDVAISKVIVSLSPLLIVAVILAFVCRLMDVEMDLNNIPLLLLSLVGSILLGCGVGSVFGVLALYAEIFLVVKSVVNRALFLMSGIFFSIDELPEGVYAFIKFIPLVHLIESMRLSFLETYPARTMQLQLAFEIIAVLLIVAIMGNTIRRRYKEV